MVNLLRPCPLSKITAKNSKVIYKASWLTSERIVEHESILFYCKNVFTLRWMVSYLVTSTQVQCFALVQMWHCSIVNWLFTCSGVFRNGVDRYEEDELLPAIGVEVCREPLLHCNINEGQNQGPEL